MLRVQISVFYLCAGRLASNSVPGARARCPVFAAKRVSA